MQEFSKIPHPLVRDGRSREERFIAALSPDYAQLDERSQEDILNFLNDYAQQVLLYNNDGTISNWGNFFDFSTPIQVALISKYNTSNLQTDYQTAAQRLTQGTATEFIAPVFDRVIEAATKINNWQKRLRNGFSLKTKISNAVEINLQQQLKILIALHNAVRAKHPTYRENLNTEPFRSNSTLWNLNALDFTQIDSAYLNVRGSDQVKFAQLKKRLDLIFEIFFNVIQQVVIESPEFYQKSLKGFDANSPHLGLMLSFLRLFEMLQGDLNQMTRRHLDFFYRDILRLQEKPIIPDQAHLVFETTPQLKDFLIEKGRVFSAGKDDADADLLFSLDDEIIIDHAQVANLRTLFLEPCETKKKKCYKKNETGSRVVNQVYASPIANSMDGLGEDFAKEVRPSWETLGAKESKLKPEGSDTVQDHPKAILGMVLASPVLLLEGGTREVTIIFDIKTEKATKEIKNELSELATVLEQTYFTINELSVKAVKDNGYPPEVIEYVEFHLGKILNPNDETTSFLNRAPVGENIPPYTFDIGKVKAEGILQRTKIFRLEFSGEEGWFVPTSDFTIKLTETQLILSKVILKMDAPAVVATHPDIHMQLGTNFLPAVKVLLLKNEIPTFKINSKIKCASVYHFLRKIEIKNTQIEVSVSDFKNVVLQSDAGILDINKPFQPFGVIPKVGSKFYIGSQELFQKNLDKLKFCITWDGLPKDEDNQLIPLNEYYKGYAPSGKLPEDAGREIKIDAKILRDGSWDNLVQKNLFTKLISNTSKIALTKIANCFPDDPPINPDEPDCASCPECIEGTQISEPIEQFNFNSNNGFIRLELTNQDFLHKEYGPALARQMMAISKTANGEDAEIFLTDVVFEASASGVVKMDDFKTRVDNLNTQAETAHNEAIDAETLGDQVKTSANAIHNQANASPTNITEIRSKALDTKTKASNIENATDDVWRETRDSRNDISAFRTYLNQPNVIPIPNEPYTPTISEFNICYSAKSSKTDVKLIHLHPYEGTYQEKNFDTALTFLPDFEYEGNLFIGLENLTPGSIVSLLFQMVESTANPDLEAAEIEWCYLKNNDWKTLRPDFEILADATEGLIQSGIVKLVIPTDINLKNTILPKELHWLRVATKQNSAAVAETLMVHTQAAKVTFQNNNLPADQGGNDITRLSNPLPAGTIAEPLENLAAVAALTQTYDSFGGRAAEPPTFFDTRVSEHLRHKGRAITLFDYERIVLEAFPEIFKVKCITHTLGRKGEASDYEIAPGFVTITVVPDVSKLTHAGKFQPKATLATLHKIEKYLKKRISPFIRLKVLNPRYEVFNIEFKVKFHEGKSEDFFTKKLQEDIQKFLAPWAFGEQERISFGGTIYGSAILNFIEQQDYVDYLTDFILSGTMLNEEGIEVKIEANELKGKTARSILVLEKLPKIKVLKACDTFTGIKNESIFIVGES